VADARREAERCTDTQCPNRDLRAGHIALLRYNECYNECYSRCTPDGIVGGDLLIWTPYSSWCGAGVDASVVGGGDEVLAQVYPAFVFGAP
jgi:hypothetical protein